MSEQEKKQQWIYDLLSLKPNQSIFVWRIQSEDFFFLFSFFFLQKKSFVRKMKSRGLKKKKEKKDF